MGSSDKTTTGQTMMVSGCMPPNCELEKRSKNYCMEVT